MASRAKWCRCNIILHGSGNPFVLVLRQPVVVFNMFRLWMLFGTGGRIGWASRACVRMYTPGCVSISMVVTMQNHIPQCLQHI